MSQIPDIPYIIPTTDQEIYTLPAVSRRFQVSWVVCNDFAIWKMGMPDLQQVILANHLRIFLRKRNSGDL